jgi:hypothetical protein
MEFYVFEVIWNVLGPFFFFGCHKGKTTLLVWLSATNDDSLLAVSDGMLSLSFFLSLQLFYFFVFCGQTETSIAKYS